MPSENKIDRIRELYESLTEDEKNQLVQEITQDEDLLSRLLAALTERSAEFEAEAGEAETFISFLKRVRE